MRKPLPNSFADGSASGAFRPTQAAEDCRSRGRHHVQRQLRSDHGPDARLGFTLVGLLITLAMVTGCRSLGPRSIPGDRSEYSNAIGESWKRQTLLNIVKLRFLDTTIFVDV